MFSRQNDAAFARAVFNTEKILYSSQNPKVSDVATTVSTLALKVVVAEADRTV